MQATRSWSECADPGPPSLGSPGILPVKCRLEDGAVSETRLLLLRRLELDELRCKLWWLFNLRGHYQLRYLDKFGDMITFSSEEEFQLALANHLPPEFRVLITPAEASRAESQLSEGEPRSARRRITFRPEQGGADTGAAVKTAAQANGAAKASADSTAAVNGASDDSPAIFKSAELKSDTVSKSAGLTSDAVSKRVPFASDAVSRRAALVTKSVALASEVDNKRALLSAAHGSAIKSASGCSPIAGCDATQQSATLRPDLRTCTDWEAAFHPDYLKPKTATSRRGDRRAGATLDIQASLAGYPLKVASSISSRSLPRRLVAPPVPPTMLPTSNAGEFVHFGIECSQCGADPLTGWRFKCSQCPNYNLCELCFHAYPHGHDFYRLP